MREKEKLYKINTELMIRKFTNIMTFHFQQCAMLNDFYVEYYFNIITKINLTKLFNRHNNTNFTIFYI
jgi:hypothetical protein